MRQAKIVIGVEQYQLLPQAVLPLAQRADPSPHRGPMLAYREVEALNERGIDLAAQGSQHGMDGLQGAKDHAVPHLHQAPPAHGLDDLHKAPCGRTLRTSALSSGTGALRT